MMTFKKETFMHKAPFIGREAEMDRLKGLLKKRSASLIVVRGRRRIGKVGCLRSSVKTRRVSFLPGLLLAARQQLSCSAMSLFVNYQEQVSRAFILMIGAICFGTFQNIQGKGVLSLYLMRFLGWEVKIRSF